jgi:ubiquinone/menaquinone biosynthesis C-methylase UbiE
MADARTWKKTAISHFGRWADHYDRDIINILLFEPSYRRVTTQLRQWRREGCAIARILDIGCGTGSLAISHLAEMAGVNSIAGLDMSDKMISIASGKAAALRLDGRVQFLIGDSEHLPFADNSFDVITCCNSFHHYPHQQRAILEMRRVLAPDGRVIIVDGSREDPLGYFIFEVCVARAEKHVHHCAAKRFKMMLNRAGLGDIRQQVVNVCPPILINTAKK